MSSSTLLGHVADRLPFLLHLATASSTSDTTASCSCIAVKIRPTLLHFLRGNRVWAVVRSKVPITDIADYGETHSEGGETRYKVLVSVADGNVWVVTMPSHFQPGVTSEMLLVRSSSGDNSDSGAVRWFCQQPGVQSVDHTPAGSGLTSLTLMRSVVTPTTLIVSTHRSSESKLQRHQSLELDDIEGEQSTCTLCLSSQVVSHSRLLKSLFPYVVNYTSVAVILVGDLDGCVRFSLVQYSSMKGDASKASVIRSGTLLQLDEPVQMIVPFTSSEQSFPSLEEHEPTLSSLVFDALLVVGSRGRIGVVELANGSSVETFPVPVNKLEIGCAVQSLVYASSLGVFVFCSSGSAFAFNGADLLVKAHPIGPGANVPITTHSSVSAAKLPLQSGIMRVATKIDAAGISILYASGRITTIDEASLRTMVVSVLPLPLQQNQRCRGSFSTSEPVSEPRVRNLLQDIAQISSKSSTLRAKSKHMDHQLMTMHSALKILRAVETTGVESVVKCELRASMITTGSFSDRQTVKLICSLHFINPEAIVSLDDWCLCLYVRICHRAVVTYSFPMNTITMRGEQSIVLDPDTLAQQDQGSLRVSCSMVFCPSGCGHTENKKREADCTESKTLKQDSPLSFGIPLVQDRRFLFAQLCQPLEEEEIPVSQVAIHSAFRQNHDPFMPIERTNKESKATSSALWSGVQWWAALADHAQTNPSFATVWSKITPPESAALALSPPSRFVISIPSFFSTEDDEEDDEDMDEDFEKIRVERMVSFLCQLLEIPIDEVPRLRRSCRTQNGKLWTVLRTLTGSLILLRFTPSEDQQRSVDLIIQCSDVADLSAMRALVLDVINNWSDGGSRVISEEDCSDELALDMDEMLEPIAALENLLESLTLKTVKRIEDLNSASCTDEVLHALSQLAQLETQTLTLYWNSRLTLNRTIM